MLKTLRTTPLLATLLLAGCSAGPTQDVALGPTLAQPNPALATTGTTTLTSASTAPITARTAASSGVSVADIATYIDAGALGQLSGVDKQEAAGAQFNALTFGRPAAPRAWVGDSGARGQVVVGPYIRVNNIDCREFTNTVTVGGNDYTRRGTACRNPDGGWSVVG
jgi:surface antigen